MNDDMTTPYMAGYHKRDDEVRALEDRLAEARREVEIVRDAISVARHQHPYPTDIFEATVEDLVRIVPNPKDRGVITGILGRIGYDECLKRIELHIVEAEEGSDE